MPAATYQAPLSRIQRRNRSSITINHRGFSVSRGTLVAPHNPPAGRVMTRCKTCRKFRAEPSWTDCFPAHPTGGRDLLLAPPPCPVKRRTQVDEKERTVYPFPLSSCHVYFLGPLDHLLRQHDLSLHWYAYHRRSDNTSSDSVAKTFDHHSPVASCL